MPGITDRVEQIQAASPLAGMGAQRPQEPVRGRAGQVAGRADVRLGRAGLGGDLEEHAEELEARLRQILYGNQGQLIGQYGQCRR